MSESPSGMRVAVTGAAGSLGRHVVARLRDHPDVATVVALDRAELPDPGPGVRFHVADVRDKDIGRHFEGCDAVLQLAFIVERGSRDPQLTEDTPAMNVVGDPVHCKEIVSRFAAAGVDELILVKQAGTVPHELVMESIRTFGEKVMPDFA